MISLTKQNLIKRRGLGLAVIAAAAALLALFTASPAFATLVLVQNYAVQQTSNRPCVIGDSSCKNTNGFYSYNTTGHPAGNNGNYILFSPTYSVGSTLTAPDTIPQYFSLGIDENVAKGAGNEELMYWDTYVCMSGCVTDQYGGSISSPTSGAVPAGYTLDANNSWQTPTYINNYKNGTGFSDALLENFSLNPNYLYFFQVSWNHDTDGMEQFFIIPGTAPPPNVPEPGSLGIFGAGLVGLGLLGFFANRRRRV